jgi:CHAT domain-containing protein/tetratricopeptide (TPR) repeat protein
MHEDEPDRLDRLAGGPRTGPRSECPGAEKLALLAAGLAAKGQSDVLMEHASRCDACGAILRKLIEDFADEQSEAETRMAESLRSSKSEWQRAMARRMAGAARGKPPIPIRTWLARAAAVIVMLGGGGWLAWNHWIANDPARLLATAYAVQRPFEYRIPGAGYTGVAPQERKGNSLFGRPQALGEAAIRIQGRLERNPEDVNALALLARGELMERDLEGSFGTLQRALEQKPEDPDLLADLGMAHALRAETLADRGVDFGYAIDYLLRSLRAKPKSRETVFNLALVYEKMSMVEKAIDEWREYLRLDPSGRWHEEAQGRLSRLEQEKKVRQAALDRISDKNPDGLLRSIDQGEVVEPEEYLDVAVTDWLPLRWEDARYERVLSALADRFVEQHHDPWLRDVLAAKRSEGMVTGLKALAAAVDANLKDETEPALEKSGEAARELRAAGNGAGALRADFEQSYALQRTVRSAACRQHAAALQLTAARMGYRWIDGQAQLAAGTCRSQMGDSGGAYQDLTRALEIGRSSGYRNLELRAEGILAGAQVQAGNMLATWSRGREGLKLFWSGPFPGIRAQQIYFNLVRSAERLALRQTTFVMESAAVGAIATTARRRAEATGRAHLAELAVEAGLPGEAQREFEHAGVLFDQLQQTASDQQYRTLAELNRARAELASGAMQAARKRLEVVLPQAMRIDDMRVQIQTKQLIGDVHWNGGNRDQAEIAYREVIDLSERRLQTLSRFSDRALLMRDAGKAYRGIVELLWERGDEVGALRVWESFRSADQPDRGNPLDLDARLPQVRHETFLTYAMLPGGITAWLFDDRGIHGMRLVPKPEELAITAQRFLRGCANPVSDRKSLERDSRQLYDWLVAPLAPRLEPGRVLVVEPDGAVGAVPVQALLDERSVYLGERFGITIAASLADYQQRAAFGSVSRDARALIIASPTLGADMIRTFPPLAGTPREGQAVAERFNQKVLLTDRQATIDAMEQYRPSAELLHFAGHGFSNAGNGGLLLSPGKGSNGAGVLSGLRVSEQNWNGCRLAVLSACSAGTGEGNGAVNPESLVRGLLWGGVKRVVASRWNVRDNSLLMERFYTKLLAGEDTATALQYAARQVREKEETSHPYYWAGFQSFGTR